MLSNTPRTQLARREEAERRLLNAAIRLLVDRGYDRFTLEEVGDLAGYSRGLPAHYFGKKEELLSEVARFIVDDYRTAQSAVEGAEPGLPKLIARIRKYSERVGSRPNLALGVLIAEARFRPKLKRAITDLNRRGARDWEAEIQAGVDVGNIRQDADPTVQSAIIYAFLRGLSAFVALDQHYDAAGATEEFIRIVMQRLAPVPATHAGTTARRGQRGPVFA
jgi:TetR/AcrR family acrAB operon transcriptional repressor